MIVKVNVAVRPITHRGSFVIKLVEVDMFKDDLLEQKVTHFEGESMGYLRDRNVPESIPFEFFISALSLGEITAELKAIVARTSGELLGESEGIAFGVLADYPSQGATTLDLKEIII